MYDSTQAMDQVETCAPAAPQNSQEQLPQISGEANTHLWQEAQLTSAGTIKSMSELQQKAPQLHRLIMDSLAMQMYRDGKRHMATIKRIYRGRRA